MILNVPEKGCKIERSEESDQLKQKSLIAKSRLTRLNSLSILKGLHNR